jgi:hypothetical protein
MFHVLSVEKLCFLLKQIFTVIIAKWMWHIQRLGTFFKKIVLYKNHVEIIFHSGRLAVILMLST